MSSPIKTLQRRSPNRSLSASAIRFFSPHRDFLDKGEAETNKLFQEAESIPW